MKGGSRVASWDSLSQSQRAAVAHEDGPAAVYAGPGSGKTRVVTLRAARMLTQGKRLLVTTFTNDATEEMRARLSPLLSKDRLSAAHITTMHALCLSILKQQGIRFQLLTDEFQRRNLAETAQAFELEGGIGGFLARQSYLKNQGQTADAYAHDGSYNDMEFARVWRAYEKLKAQKDLREFDDLILDAMNLLATQESVRQNVAAHYTHIIVDECQDMNVPQYRVAFALAQDHKNLMLVGDLDQSLYAFRGADTRTFRVFAAHPSTQVYELRENYRCTRSILFFADNLIRQDTERRALAFVPTRPEGEPVVWERFPDPDIEALAVGNRILRLHENGLPFQDMAVLYRTNAQSEAFERHFAALGIPYTLREDGDFYARKEVQGLLAYLRFFARPKPKPGASPPPEAHADEWLLALLNVPNRKIARATGGQLRNWAELRGKRIWDILPEFHAADLKTHKVLRHLIQELKEIEAKLPTLANAGEAIRVIRKATYFDEWLRREEADDRDNDRLQNVQRMQAAAARYATIEEYLEAVQRVRNEAARRKAERARKRRQQDEVTLGTGHSAKGLEWRVVFAVGWSEDLLPHRKAEDIREERRIAYVIATRARDLLFLSSLDSWNDAVTAPSRFLSGMNPMASSDASKMPLALSQDASKEEALGGLFMPP
jgi:DNA helicase-2/ATP-dependent DNA helicase PcrA